MTSINKHRILFVVVTLMLMPLIPGCGVYSFTGASIPPEAKTVSIQYFPNRSILVEATLSATFTDIIRDMFVNQTSLEMVDRKGDLSIEGEIIDYSIKPVAIQADQTAGQNRLSITVNARFTNKFEPDKDFESKFTQFQDYDPTASFNSIKDELINEICDDIAQDIFDKAVINW